MRAMRIAIAGAGIGGLTAALALQRMGHRATVFEKAKQLAPVGTGIVLAPNAMAPLRRLGLEPAVLQAGRPLEQIAVVDQRGRQLSTAGGPLTVRGQNLPTVAIHRGALQTILVEACRNEGIDLRLGRTLSNFRDDEDGVTLDAGGGSREQDAAKDAHDQSMAYDLLVGADGLHSVLRPLLHDQDDLRFAGYRCFRGVTERAFDLRGHGTECWGRGRRLGLFPLGDGSVYWFAVENANPGQLLAPAQIKQHVLRHFAGFGEGARSILEATEQILQHDLADRQPLEQWGRGRVTLLGDAAHPMTPNMGQGACQAIEDAARLAAELGPDNSSRDARESLRAYESARIERANQFVRESWRLGKIAQLENPVLCWLRNWAVRMTPERITRTAMQKLLAPDANLLPAGNSSSDDTALRPRSREAIPDAAAPKKKAKLALNTE